MGNIHNSITELVGNTPIVEFHRLKEALGLKGRIAGKLEYFNPAGSHKDRMALEIIEAAERRGDISPDKTTLVEFYKRKYRCCNGSFCGSQRIQV